MMKGGSSLSSKRSEQLEAQLEAARIKYETGDFDRAYKIFKKISHEFPDNPVSFFYRGLILAKRGKMEKAINKLKDALQRDPTYSEVKLHLASLYYEIGMYVEASRFLNRSLEDPLPEKIEKRMEMLKEVLEDPILTDLSRKSTQIATGLSSGTAIREIGEGLGILLGVLCTLDGGIGFCERIADWRFRSSAWAGQLKTYRCCGG